MPSDTKAKAEPAPATSRSELRAVAPDLLIAALLLVFGVYMLVQSLGYHLFVEGGRIGPGFMPFVAGALLALFSVWVGIEVLQRARSAAPAAAPAGERLDETLPASAATSLTGDEPEVVPGEPAEWEPGAEAGPANGRVVMAVFGLTVLATILTYFVGYVVAFGFITVVMLLAVERERWWLGLLVGAAATVVAWVVFVRLLGVPLPGGSLGLLGSG